MKKFLSVALLLSMLLGMLAGCQFPTPEAPAENPLDAAVAYLKNMYDKSTKDEDNKLTADKELLPGVTIDGVFYSVTWAVEVTSGPAACIAIAEGAAAGSQKIDIVTQPEEEVRFTLTGTVSDADGNTATIAIKFYSPAVEKVEVEDGKQVVIKIVADAKYATGTEYEYTSSSGSKKMELILSDKKADAVAFTLITNDDGSVTFKTADGYFLSCDGNSVEFVKAEGNATKFFLEPAEGGQYIKSNVISHEKEQYLEVYSGYLTCYGMNVEKTDLYIFELEDAEGANGKVVKAGEPSDEPEADPTPTYPVTNAPFANGDKVVIVAGAYNKALSSTTIATHYLAGVDVTVADGAVAGYGNTEIWTVIVNADGTYSFEIGGKKLSMQDSYNSMNLGYANDKWTLASLENGSYVLKNTVRGNYVEWYAEKNNWSTMDTEVLSDLFELSFYVVDGTTTPDQGGTENPGTNPENPGTGDSGSTVTAPFANGDKVVIVAGAYNKALSSTTIATHYLAGVDVTVANGAVTGYGDTEVWTVIVNADGTYSFEIGGKKLSMQDSYNSMNLGYANDKWTLASLENGSYVLKNTVRGNYVEWYAEKNNWSTMNTEVLSDLFELSFYVVDGTTTPDQGGTENPGTNPENPGTNPENPGTGDSGSTVTAPFANGDKIVIVCGAYNKALSSLPASAGSFYQMGVDVTVTDGIISGYANTEIWTVIANDDGTYSFAINGQNLGMQSSYASMSLGAVNDKWELVALDNGTYALKNTVRGNYIEWYADKNNWSSYNTENLSNLFQLSFYVVDGTTTPDDGGETPDQGGTENPGTGNEPTDEPTTGINSADFGTFNNLSSNGADSQYTKTHTTTNGWTTVNSAIQAGGVSDSNPIFKVFGPDNTHKAVCLNGKTSAPGKLTSPTLKGGINKLTFNYTKCFTDTKLGVTVTITDLATGTAYTKDLDITLDKNDKYTVQDFEFVLDTPITGDFTIEIVNKCPTGQDSNKDRISIWNLTWN